MGFGQRSLVSFGDRGEDDPGKVRDLAPSDRRPTAPPAGQAPEPMTVGQATRVIKDLLTSEPRLQDIQVAGEMSNVKASSAGHLYFTLKDEEAQMPCVMFARRGSGDRVDVEEGDKVVVTGRIDVYEPHGRYQLIADSIVKRGVGDLYQRFLELKERLEREGLFRDEHKRAIPYLPRRIGVVTSSTGSVFHDIVRVIRRRYPHVRVTLVHAAVQGERAAAELVSGLGRLSSLGDVDVIIIGRGGGSFEDLWPFNDEGLARAISACQVPVVSAVGHETDFTISDFVADRRAPTPSAAAEMVVPSTVDETRMLRGHGERLLAAITRRLGRDRDRLDGMTARPVLRRPLDMVEVRQQRLDDLARRLGTTGHHTMEVERGRLSSLEERLEALSPRGTLERGYSIALDDHGRLVSSVEGVSPGDQLELVLSDGRVDTRAERVRPDEDPT
jgi:exodeoxyribonuclease VII large subunit